MNPSPVQALALEQMRDVEVFARGLFNIEDAPEPENSGASMAIGVVLDCRDLARAEGGLPLNDREQIIVVVPHNFPFEKPSAYVRHDRFDGFPHVQWKHFLCLYQAPSTEWNPSDGMFGFLDRLHYWFKQGAIGQLDPVGGPLHPPVTYVRSGPTRTVIPRSDVPSGFNEPWFGTAHLRIYSDTRVDIVGWSPALDPHTPCGVAAAILLPTQFPWEFPAKVGDVIGAIEAAGVSLRQIVLSLQWAVVHNGEDAPLYVVLGSPMRRAENGDVRQHLTAWRIEPLVAWGLKAALDKYSVDDVTRARGAEIEQLVLDWAKNAEVSWCVVREDRPEIVTRRDHASAVSWFAGHVVALWGCGALGGYVAEYLVRGGVKKLLLYDEGIVTPGILVRQPFDDDDISLPKATALANRLRRIRPDVAIDVSVRDILDVPLGGPNWTGEAEVIIDATAAASVAALLEERRWRSGANAVPVISMVIGHDAKRGMVVLAHAAHSGGPLDAARQLKLECCNRTDLSDYAAEFWPSDIRPFFQPEPGCSDATFVGSAADVASLAGMMLNLAATDLGSNSDGKTAIGHLVTLPSGLTGESHSASFSWRPDLICEDIEPGVQVRIGRGAWGDLQEWIAKSRKDAGPEVETGGLLFGERDEAARVLWVTEVSGPPPDSVASADKFICGIEGTAALNAEKRSRTRGSVHYLGMWHTHPDSLPLPSSTDFAGMRRLVRAAGGAGRVLLLIVGATLRIPMLGTYVFRAADLRRRRRRVQLSVVQTDGWSSDEPESDKSPTRSRARS